MKVLNLISSIAPELGGSVELVRMLSEALIDEGCTVTVVSLDKGREKLEFSSAVSHIVLDRPRLGIRYSFSFQLIAWLRRNARRFDVVIVHGIWQFPTLAAWQVLPQLGVPYLIYAHGHLTDYALFSDKGKIPKKLLYWALVERRTLANAAAVLFTSEWEKTYSEKAAWATGLRGAVIKHGLPPPPFEAQNAAEQLVSKGLHVKPYLLCLGRLHPMKGIDIALQSLAAVNIPHLRLVIAGKGESGYEHFLRQMVTDLDLADRVHFIGHVHGADKWGLIREAYALLAPSHHENFGIAIVEALSVGCPVLTTHQVGVWREIDRFQAGQIFAANVVDCADVIREFAQLSDSQYSRIRDNACACFNSEFSIQMTARSLIQLCGSFRKTPNHSSL